MAIGAYSVPSPTGKINAVLPVLSMGPSTKLAVLPPVDDAVLVRDNKLVEVVFTIPSVKVNTAVTLASCCRVIPAALVLLIVRLLNDVTELPLINCPLLSLNETVPLLAVKVPLLFHPP